MLPFESHAAHPKESYTCKGPSVPRKRSSWGLRAVPRLFLIPGGQGTGEVARVRETEGLWVVLE